MLPLFIALGLPLSTLCGVLLWRYAVDTGSTLAYRDDLTGLGNRRAFKRYAEPRLRDRRSGSQSMILVDVDSLKLVNESCGHLAGDELLSRLANQLMEAAPQPESVFRFGGDEFAILVDRSNGESATEVVAKLTPFNAIFSSCGHEHAVAISYGITSNIHGESFEELFKRADLQLGEHKRRLHYTASLALADKEAQLPPEGDQDPGTKIASLAERRRRQTKRTGS